MTVIPLESATILGRQAQAYTTPVIARTSAAVTTAAWSRPWMARSIRTMRATTNHAHDRTEEPALRKTSRSLSGSLRDDACCDNTAGLQVRGRGGRTEVSRRRSLAGNLAPAHFMPAQRSPVTNQGPRTARDSGAYAVRHSVGHRMAIGMQRGEGGGRHQPHPDPDRPLVHVEHGLVDIEVGT